MAVDASLPFKDVATTDWFYDGVKYAYDNGLMVGTSNTTFAPATTTTRAMVVTILYRLDGSPVVTTSGTFTDVAVNSWYTAPIEWAAANGIVSGYGNRLFGPNNTITREQMATIMCRYSDYKGYDVSRQSNLSRFSDVAEISSWAKTSMAWTNAEELITGTSSTTLSPKGDATRAQIAVILKRFGNYVVDNTVSGQEMDVAYETDVSHISTDDVTGISYVNNVILIFFKDSKTQEDEERIVASINGQIIGRFDTINQIQVQVRSSSLDELIAICNTVEKFESVLCATYDVATQVETNMITVPNDKWNDDDWNEEFPGGNNWWLEAIQAPSAWNYNGDMQTIKIGIVDNGFDTGHEDLKGKISFPNDTYAHGNNKEDHGSHVAGIIGANANNKKGITGIVWNSNLICFDWKPSWVQEMLGGWDTSTFIAAGLIETVKSGAKVVNFSLGTSGNLANHGLSYSTEQINSFGSTASLYVAGLLHQGYDFVVVQSAGNGAADGIGVDAINNGWFSSITRDNCFNGLRNVDEVLTRIIIVGAAQQNGNSYIQAPFSNGGSQVDICAPGVDVYSTVTGGISGKYAKMSGTSMAAPIVTGVAALVWAADPSLSGNEVKAIVCNPDNSGVLVPINTASPNATGTFRMVNAMKCVEDALNIVKIPEIHYYEFFDSVVDSWEDAQNYCKSLGGHLATLTSQEENNYVYQEMLDAGYKNAYFGLTDVDTEGTWKWITGEPLSYQNWHKGEPNSENQNEDYAMFYYKYSDGTWNDGDFGGRTVSSGRVFICEWDDAEAYESFQNRKEVWLEELPVTSSDRYTGNMGDSFIDRLGTRNGKTDVTGNTYTHGLEAWVARWNYTNEMSWVWNTYKLGSKYNSLTGTVSIIADSYNTDNFDTTLEILGDGHVLYSTLLTPQSTQLPIAVKVTSVDELTIYLYDNSSTSGGTSFALGNFMLS